MKSFLAAVAEAILSASNSINGMPEQLRHAVFFEDDCIGRAAAGPIKGAS